MLASCSNDGKRDEARKRELGQVLQVESTSRVLESEWVALVRAMAHADERGLHALYARMHRIVFALCLRITRGRECAEEVTLDVFHEAWRRASQYDPNDGTVVGWIMNLARSRAIDRVRFERRRERPGSGKCSLPSGIIAGEFQAVLISQEESRILHAALARLAPTEREAIETAYFGGLTYTETALRLKQPIGTIKTRIRSGLQKLRGELERRAVSP